MKLIKTILIITIVSYGGLNLKAQDIIFLKSGEEVKALVTEVTNDLIRYKKYDNKQGPTYSVQKQAVFMIRYENGTKDLFDTEEEVLPQTTSRQKETDQTLEKKESSSLPQTSFNINPLGLIQFGPIFQLEVKVAPRSYLTPHFRYAFAGVLTHAVWTEFEEDSELSAGTAAIGVGLKSFAETTGNTWYYGAVVDLGWATARYDVSETSASEEKATTLSALSNVGYRWRSTHNTYVNVGLYAGVSFDLKAEERRLDNNELIEMTDETTLFAMLEISFGWEF